MTIPQNTFAEEEYAVLRRHGSVLFLPVVILGALAALFFFLEPKLEQSWQHQVLLGGVLLLAFLFWLLPSIRFFTNRYEITSNRVIVHRGLTGSRVEEAAWGELTGVSISRGFGLWIRGAGDIRLHREFGVDLVLKHVPRAKRLTREFETFMTMRQGMGQ